HRPRAPHRGVTDVGGDRLGAEVHVDPLLARGLGRRGLVLPVGVLLAVGILAISVLAVGVLSVLGVVGILLLGSLDLFRRGLDRAALEGGLEGTGALQGVDQLIGDRIGIGDLHAVALLGHDLDDLALLIDLLDAVLGLDGVLLGPGGAPLAHTLLIDRDRQGLAALVRPTDSQPLRRSADTSWTSPSALVIDMGCSRRDVMESTTSSASSVVMAGAISSTGCSTSKL